LADKVLSKVTEEEMEQLFKKGDLGVGNRLATFEVIISPFFVETPGMLKVDVRVDGKPLNLPTLAFLEPGAAASSEFVLSVLPRTKAKRSVAKRTTAKRPTAK